VASSKRVWGFLTTLAVVAILVVVASAAEQPKTPPASTVIKDLKPGQVGIVAYYPLNSSHKYIADYLKSLEQDKEFKGKVKVEVYDMQSAEGRERWKTTGLDCAGVFVNGKTRWEVLRDGKKVTVDFVKRMDSFWTKDEFLAVVRQQLKDPKKTPVVPSAKPAAEKPEDQGKSG
jgi:hypothetical protein